MAASPLPLAAEATPLGDVPPEPRNPPRGQTSILIAADMVALGAALAITYGVAELAASHTFNAPTWLVIVLNVTALPAWVAIFTAYNLYERQNRSISLSTFDEVGELFAFASLTGGILCLILAAGF